MNDYTPTTEQVRKAYKNSVVDVWGTKKPNAEFDRWLTEVKAEAWQSGWYAKDYDVNPYRKNNNE